MQDIILRFDSTGYKCCHQVAISIFDNHKNLIFQGKTYNGKIKISLEKEKVYLLEAILDSKRLQIPFYVTNYSYCFSFNNLKDYITFRYGKYYIYKLKKIRVLLLFFCINICII